jgi:DNA-binding LytR/AlgR family response regulator
MNLTVAIVEDEKIHANQLINLINGWAKEKAITVNTVLFSSASLFLQSFGKDAHLDAAFLDIYLPDGNGMDIALKIRKYDAFIPIAFITKSKEYVDQGYNVWAIHYLIKPASYVDIERCMDRIVLLKKQIKEQTFTFKFESIVRVLDCKDILYFQSNQHYIEIQSLKGNYRFRENINVLKKQLPEQFLMCNRSTIINLSHLYLYDAKASFKNVTLSDGTRIPISQSYSKIIMEKCFQMLY